MQPLIRQIENWQDAKPSEILAYFQESVTTARPNRLNANDLFKLLGTETACGLAAALSAAGLGLVNQSIASVGIDFGDDETQRMLAKLAEANPAFQPYADVLMGLGKYTATRWERNAGPAGPAELPTVEEIAETVAAMKAIDAKIAVREWRDTVLLPLVDAMTNAGNSIEEIKVEISK